MFTNILVPTDGSRAAREAAVTVSGLVTGHPDTKATVVVVIAPYDAANTDFDAAVVEQRNAAMRRHAQDVLKTTADILAGQGVLCSTKILEGDPVSAAIAREAGCGGYDLIAMSSRGMGRQRDSLHYVGSVTEHVIRRSPIPVLVIPVSEEKD